MCTDHAGALFLSCSYHSIRLTILCTQCPMNVYQLGLTEFLFHHLFISVALQSAYIRIKRFFKF